MSEQIRREFTLAFPIETVKTAIEHACLTSQLSYQIKDRNPAFNSYSIALVKHLYLLSATVTLKAISENESHFEFSAIPGPKLSQLSAFTSELIEDFLKHVGDYACGRYVYVPPTPEEQAKAKANQKGGIAVLIIVGIIIVAVLYFILR